jgi:hypothetical protein
VLNSTDKLIGALFAALGLSLTAGEARADLFDFLRPKKAPIVSRSQSPDGRSNGTGSFGTGTYSSRNLWQPPSASANQYAPDAATSSAGVQNGWGYEAAPDGNYGTYDFGGGGPTVNCGECDQHQGRVSFCRKLCHQTYYPRSAPYCAADWGWNQTCWRRMKDNYSCPRPDWHGSSPEPPAALPPQTPVAPPTTTYLPVPPRTQANRSVSYGQPPTLTGSITGQSPPGRDVRSASPESSSDSGDWNYEEESGLESNAVQPATVPPRNQGRGSYYSPPGVQR